MTEKLDMFYMFKKNIKRFAWEEDFIHEINLCYMYWIKQQHNKYNYSWSFSLFQNLLKKLDLYLRKIQISF